MKHLIRYFTLFIVLLAGLIALIVPTSTGTAAGNPILPAPIANGIKPTLSLNINRGLPGVTITASGQGVSPYPGVRLVWLDEQTSASLAVAPLGSGQAYTAQVKVPMTAVPGPNRICAAVTGTSQAAFTCQNFTVDIPAPGSVNGQLPLSLNAAHRISEINNPDVLDADVNLYDQQGNSIASTAVAANGSFTLGNVPPGTYTAAVAGIVPVVVQSSQITVQSGNQTIFNPVALPQCSKGQVVAVRMTPSGKATNEFDFGSYVNYWPYDQAGPKLIYEIDMQLLSGTTLGLMAVYFDGNDGIDHLYTTVNAPAQGTTYQFSKWVASVDVGVRQFKFRPGVSGGSGCTAVPEAIRRVNIIEHPMQNNALQGYVDRRVNDLVWDGSRYAFDVKVHSSYSGYDFLIPYFSINGEQALPITFPSPPPDLPYLGEQNNTLGGTPFNVQGTIDLDGNITLQAVRTRARSHIMSQNDIINQINPLFPEGGDIPASSAAASSSAVSLYRANAAQSLTDELRQFEFAVDPITLFDFDEEIPVYEGLLFSAAGLANVRISIVLGVSGDMVVQGWIRPLDPTIAITSTTHVRPRVEVSVILDAIFGIVSGGATAETEAEMRFPIIMDSSSPDIISLEDACMQLNVTLYFWARVNILFDSEAWNLDPETIVDYSEGNCGETQRVFPSGNGNNNALKPFGSVAVPANLPPRILTAPHIASAANGNLLATYIEDSAPDAAHPAPKVMAAFWNNQTKQWGQPVALTNGSHMVQDAVAAYYSNSGQAMIAWSQNPITPAEEQAATGLNDILKRQEIYYAIWNGSQWGSPVRLTNDQLPDGQAAIAGDNQGITLAWVNDADGDLATRTDWRIAVRQWDGGSWSDITLLNGHFSNAANYQVSADRQMVQNNSHRVLAWTVDGDGNLATTGDRYITVFDWNGTNWGKDPSNSLPLRSDSPSVAFIPGGQDLSLAFLRRVADGSGNDGGLGNNANLWSARRTFGGTWSKFEVTDETGAVVRAEQPQVDVSASGESLIIFRRFGTVATYAELGQIALTRLMPNGQAYDPLYITDEPRQHWQAALGIDAATDEAVLLNVSRPIVGEFGAASSLRPAANGRETAVAATILSGTSGDLLESAVIQPEADPALNSTLELSQLHAPAGTMITITTTLHNSGRADATGLQVKLYEGIPGSGSLLDTQATTNLTFNESRTINFQVIKSAGEMPVYAQVVTSGGNVSLGNDVATAVLGALLPPTLVRVDPSPFASGAAQIAWQAPALPDIAGYRILRATTSGGSYELVGETTANYFTDLLLANGTTYYYAVQAYDATGIVSPNSEEAAFTLANSTIYLPFMQR